jgi:hypothetical protein
LQQRLFPKQVINSNLFNRVVFREIFFDRSFALRKAQKFLSYNSLRYTVKRRLGLSRRKAFFYSVHVAAPKKKDKKWSLYGLKKIYYRKVSLYYGFKRVTDFLKMRDTASSSV